MGRTIAKDRLVLGRGIIAFFVFASFATLWSGLALPLGAPPWTFGTTAIGLFGLAGLAGAAGAARAGRWADSGRAQSVTGGSLVLLAASWLLIARTEPTLWLLVIGIVVLDFAVQAVHVSSQHLLTTAHPDHTGSVIGAYMVFYSLGSAVGAITTTWTYSVWGWRASCLAGALFALAGFIVWGVTRSAPATRQIVGYRERNRLWFSARNRTTRFVGGPEARVTYREAKSATPRPSPDRSDRSCNKRLRDKGCSA